MDQKQINQIAGVAHESMADKMPGRLDDFIKWIATGVAAILALAISNADALLKIFSTTSFKLSMGLFLLSLVFATLARAVGSLVLIGRSVHKRIAKKLPEAFGIDAGALRQPTGPASPEATALIKDVIGAMAEPLYRPFRWLIWRSAKKGLDEQAGRDRAMFMVIRLCQIQAFFCLSATVVALSATSIAVFTVHFPENSKPTSAQMVLIQAHPGTLAPVTRTPVSTPASTSTRPAQKAQRPPGH